MLQKEVVERIVAIQGNKTYGRLSVAIQARADVEALFTIGPEAFHPRPKVDSAILRVIPRQDKIEHIQNPELFDSLLQQAFGQRRKILRNSLKKLVDASIFELYEIDASKRAEMLSVDDFVRLANALNYYFIK